MRHAVIFDMDGTLANVSSIRHHLKPVNRRKDFESFHSESVNVPPHRHVVYHAQLAYSLGHAVLIVTARKHRWRHHTAWWLALNNVPSDMLMMRRDDDHRPDYEVKRDMLHIIGHYYEVVHAVDDNPSVIELWNEFGIPTTVVPGWEVE